MELEMITKVPVERLRLDRRNPRLHGESEKASDEELVAWLYRAAELDELLQSISANGYMDIESLIVMGVPDADNGELVVLEGNRRLAALRLLREPELAGRIASSQGFRIKVPPIDESLSSTLDHVSVYPVANRERARPFIGFKHINGPAKWDAYAKAQFAAEWCKSGRSKGIDLADIARAIGDRHNTIKRMVSAVYVLEQARDEDLFDVEDRHVRRFNFSHLYTALTRSQYMEYLGLELRVGASRPGAGSGPSRTARRASERTRLDLRIEAGQGAAGRAVAEPRHQAPRGSARPCPRAARAANDARSPCSPRQHCAGGLAVHRIAHSSEGQHAGFRQLAQSL